MRHKASTSAAVRYHWGAPNKAQSDEYNGTAVDLRKWGLFGAGVGQRTGCTAGFNGHGRRCASQTTERDGMLTVRATADGVTGGMYSTHGDFRYGRVEIRERSYPTANNGGAAWHAVPLLWPRQDYVYPRAEIDFAERDIGYPYVDLHVHHSNRVTSCHVQINSTQFHNYAIDWQPRSVSWYVDGRRICSVKARITSFDHPNGGAQIDMYPPSGTLMRPARQDIDWIRMYPVRATRYRS